MAREYFRNKVDKDMETLFRIVVWVFILVVVGFGVAVTIKVAQNNYKEAIQACIQTKGYSEEYCKFLAK